MRTLSLIVFAMVLLGSVTPSLAAPHVGLLVCGHGTLPDSVACGGGGCTTGDGAFMLTGMCAGGSLTKQTGAANYIQGVCGDNPALPGYALQAPCGNQFVYRSEVCTMPGTDNTSGSVSSNRVWGKWRLCFDPNGLGDCSGVTPTGTVISSGSALGFSVELVGSGPITLDFENTRVTQSGFFFNGSNRSMSFKYALGHYTSEHSGTSCAAYGPTPLGCGFEGCLTKLK